MRLQPTTEQTKVETRENKKIKVKWNGDDNRRLYPHNLHTAILEGKWTLSELKLLLFVYDRGWGYPENEKGYTKPVTFKKISQVIKVSRAALTEAAITLTEKNVIWVKEPIRKFGNDVFSFKVNEQFDTWTECDLDEYIQHEIDNQPARLQSIKSNNGHCAKKGVRI